jgi:hypothetical protein
VRAHLYLCEVPVLLLYEEAGDGCLQVLLAHLITPLGTGCFSLRLLVLCSSSKVAEPAHQRHSSSTQSKLMVETGSMQVVIELSAERVAQQQQLRTTRSVHRCCQQSLMVLEL